ncbi:MAG: MGMT family protein [Cyanobacteriota bacterium]|nr:MGMT family protein [Cyanobacteriota bacterium]
MNSHPSSPRSRLYAHIYAVVQGIPAGKVATYGQVAAWAGYPGYARQVGYALFRCRGEDSAVPWQRVVNAQGSISYSPFRLGSDQWQRVLLEAEGIRFDEKGRISLQEYGWLGDPLILAQFPPLQPNSDSF